MLGKFHMMMGRYKLQLWVPPKIIAVLPNVIGDGLAISIVDFDGSIFSMSIPKYTEFRKNCKNTLGMIDGMAGKNWRVFYF